MANKTWLITGAGGGLGRAFAEAALDRGDRVVATTRNPNELEAALNTYGDNALVIGLELDDRAAIRTAIDAAISRVGRLDVVVNNAGYGLTGGIEEISESQARAQIETNFFAPLWITQAVLPHMRERKSGHIIQISSISAIKSGLGFGLYCASKAALESMSESLAREVAPFGIKVTIVEPSRFRTEWAGSNMERANGLDAYENVLRATRTEYARDASHDSAPGDPLLAAERIIEIVDSTDPPLRLLLGNKAVDIAAAVYQGRLDSLAAWETVSRSVDAVNV